MNKIEKIEPTKAIDIKGKKYILVADRVIFFNETYKNGMITTELLSKLEDTVVVVKAKAIPDADKPDRFFTGYSQAKIGDGYINKTSALENCETSAVGRALGFMGIGVIDSIASVDEINKAKQSEVVKETIKDIKKVSDFMKASKMISECGDVVKLDEYKAKISESRKYTIDERKSLLELISGNMSAITGGN